MWEDVSEIHSWLGGRREARGRPQWFPRSLPLPPQHQLLLQGVMGMVHPHPPGVPSPSPNRNPMLWGSGFRGPLC